MNHEINLWESITAAEQNHRCDEEGRELKSCGPRVSGEDLSELGNTGRWNGQELTVEATPEGWKIRVFSCYSDCSNHDEVVILIPKNHQEPVKILKDQIGRIAHLHP